MPVAHRSKAVAEYVGKMGGMVVLWFLPPRTPRHNPVEVLWREIRRAIADVYFGGIGRMRAAIIRMLRRGEVAIVSLFRYMLEAMDCRGPVARACTA